MLFFSLTLNSSLSNLLLFSKKHFSCHLFSLLFALLIFADISSHSFHLLVLGSIWSSSSSSLRWKLISLVRINTSIKCYTLWSTVCSPCWRMFIWTREESVFRCCWVVCYVKVMYVTAGTVLSRSSNLALSSSFSFISYLYSLKLCVRCKWLRIAISYCWVYYFISMWCPLYPWNHSFFWRKLSNVDIATSVSFWLVFAWLILFNACSFWIAKSST